MISLTLVSKDAKTVEIEKVISVTFESESGKMELLEGHAEFFFTVKAGPISIKKESGVKTIDAGEGWGYFYKNNVAIGIV